MNDYNLISPNRFRVWLWLNGWIPRIPDRLGYQRYWKRVEGIEHNLQTPIHSDHVDYAADIGEALAIVEAAGGPIVDDLFQLLIA